MSTPLLEQVTKSLRFMEAYQQNPSDSTKLYYKKFFLFSAHDFNLLVLLDAIGVLDKECMIESML